MKTPSYNAMPFDVMLSLQSKHGRQGKPEPCECLWYMEIQRAESTARIHTTTLYHVMPENYLATIVKTKRQNLLAH